MVLVLFNESHAGTQVDLVHRYGHNLIIRRTIKGNRDDHYRQLIFTKYVENCHENLILGSCVCHRGYMNEYVGSGSVHRESPALIFKLNSIKAPTLHFA